MACPGEVGLVRYLAGELEESEHQVAESHIAGCPQCTGFLSGLTHEPAQAREISAAGSSPRWIDRDRPGNATERMPQDADKRAKMMWLERHYHLQIGDVVDGKYKIEKIIGEGGMGIVLAAEHLALRERVALKFMHPTMASNPTHSARFMREARSAVKLRDENVARVLDLGQVDETGPFIVMEYLAGQDLLHYLKAKAPLPIGEAIELLRQAANGVAAAHEAGIIHRDLKPSNMFLTEKREGLPLLKVLDFGVSKYIEGDSLSVTGTNVIVGSPQYMAPELFESARNASRQSDVWALGVIFYRMLTARMPFVGDSLPEVIGKINFGAPTPVTQWRPELPAAIVQLIERCLRRQASARFETARDLLASLELLPAHVRADPHAPTTRVPAPTGPPPSHTPAPAAATISGSHVIGGSHGHGSPQRSPWAYVIAGAIASAALFAVVFGISRQEPTDHQAAPIEPSEAVADEPDLDEPEAAQPDPPTPEPGTAPGPDLDAAVAPSAETPPQKVAETPPKKVGGTGASLVDKAPKTTVKTDRKRVERKSRPARKTVPEKDAPKPAKETKPRRRAEDDLLLD